MAPEEAGGTRFQEQRPHWAGTDLGTLLSHFLPHWAAPFLPSGWLMGPLTHLPALFCPLHLFVTAPS